MANEEEVPWEARCADVAYEFALSCARLVSENPYQHAAPLNGIISNLMTELWDRNFSQSEIRTAFELAIKAMLRYSAGDERRSPSSAELVTTNWQRTKTHKATIQL